MLCIKTKLKKSNIHGIGLFTDQKLPKGNIVWKANGALSYNVYSKKEWQKLKNKLNKHSFEQIKKYAYKYKNDNQYRVDLDDTRFINHSNKPNTTINKAGNMITIKLIKRGEEITMNYDDFYDE
jgi:SET domain-containing protein